MSCKSIPCQAISRRRRLCVISYFLCSSIIRDLICEILVMKLQICFKIGKVLEAYKGSSRFSGHPPSKKIRKASSSSWRCVTTSTGKTPLKWVNSYVRNGWVTGHRTKKCSSVSFSSLQMGHRQLRQAFAGALLRFGSPCYSWNTIGTVVMSV